MYQWRQSLDVFIEQNLELVLKKTPLLKVKHTKYRLAYASNHLEHGSKYWSNETKLFGYMNSRYAWRKVNKAHKLKNSLPAIKHGGRHILLWGCFAVSGPGELVRVQGIMDKEQYFTILKNNITQSTRKQSLERH